MAAKKLYTHLVSDFMQVLYFPGRFPNSFNQELLDLYRSYQPELSCVLFTASPIHRFPDLLSQLEGVFDPILTVDEVGSGKGDPRTYQWLAKKLSTTPERVIFIDDSPTNVEAAASVGVCALQYRKNEEVKWDLRSILCEVRVDSIGSTVLL